MSSKEETEKEWLRTVAIPEMLESGVLTENAQNSDVNLKDLRIYEIEINFIGSEEAFMLTSCYRATIEYELNAEQYKQYLVVKRTPPLPAEIFDGINFTALFNNEILAYTKIIPKIVQFTKQSFEIPKYFYSDLQRYAGSIILEDFALKGWRVTKERYNLSLEHVLLAVKYLAGFHGIGFAMRAQNRTEFDEITCKLKEPRFESTLTDDFALQLKHSILRLLKATRQYESSVNEKFLKKLEQLLIDSYGYGKQRVLPVEPFITLCHGDFLRNNIAFRYTEKDGVEVPNEVMMFDLQTIRLSSPMLDLNALLMLSAFAEVRHKNFELIFETYRKKLIESYEKYTGKAAPEIFSYDSLLKEFIRYMPLSIQIASFFLMNIVAPPECSPDEFLLTQRTPEEIINDLMSRGGEVVDRELSHQVKELYELSSKHGVDIAEGINVDLLKI